MTLQNFQRLYHKFCPRLEVTILLAGVRCRVNVNDHFMWLVYPESYTIEGSSYELMRRHWGKVWDVGCNFGFYSMVAANAGNEVFAFDMSPHAVRLLEQGLRLNGFAVTAVARPMTTVASRYAAVTTSACTNRCQAEGGDLTSMTYLEAEKLYGTPDFIKMDIEGGEKEFLESDPFAEWVTRHRITLLVEVHDRYELRRDAFPAMRRQQLDAYHLLLSPS